MKRFIRAAADNQYDKYFGDIKAEAANAGYTLKISENAKVMLVANKDADIMPTITVDTIDNGGGKLGFLCKLEFPTLDGAKDEYADTIESILDKWADIGALITHIQEYEIDSNMDIE